MLSDLVGWWKFDDASDSTGSRTLTLLPASGGPTIVGGTLAVGTTLDARARTSAFNPTGSFSIVFDFKLNALPAGAGDPQAVLLANIGDDASAGGGNFDTSAGYQIFVHSNGYVYAWQKNVGGFTQSTSTGVTLGAAPTDRHTVVVNWTYSGGLFTPTIFLDGSAITATATTAMPMNFDAATLSLLIGNNIDYKKGSTRTLNGIVYETAIFNGVFDPGQVTLVAQGGVAALSAVPEPTTLALLGLGAAVVMARGRRRRTA